MDISLVPRPMHRRGRGQMRLGLRLKWHNDSDGGQADEKQQLVAPAQVATLAPRW